MNSMQLAALALPFAFVPDRRRVERRDRGAHRVGRVARARDRGVGPRRSRPRARRRRSRSRTPAPAPRRGARPRPRRRRRRPRARRRRRRPRSGRRPRVVAVAVRSAASRPAADAAAAAAPAAPAAARSASSPPTASPGAAGGVPAGGTAAAAAPRARAARRRPPSAPAAVRALVGLCLRRSYAESSAVASSSARGCDVVGSSPRTIASAGVHSLSALRRSGESVARARAGSSCARSCIGLVPELPEGSASCSDTLTIGAGRRAQQHAIMIGIQHCGKLDSKPAKKWRIRRWCSRRSTSACSRASSRRRVHV